MVDEEKGKPISIWIGKNEDDQKLLEKIEKAAEIRGRTELSTMMKIILEENVDKYLKR